MLLGVTDWPAIAGVGTLILALAGAIVGIFYMGAFKATKDRAEALAQSLADERDARHASEKECDVKIAALTSRVDVLSSEWARGIGKAIAVDVADAVVQRLENAR